jgi:hypothetical protein
MTNFLGIDWGAFALVFVVALVATAVIVSSFATALRLLAAGSDVGHRPPAAAVGAYACFAVGVAAVLYGLYLIIPQFH